MLLHVVLHIGALDLMWESDRQPHTIWHSLAPQTRLLCVFLSVFAIAIVPNGQWLTWMFYGAVLLVVLYLSQVSLGMLAKRMAVESAFISVILLGTLFRGGGHVLWSWGWLQITTNGLTILGSVALKALLSLLILNVLTLSTSLPLLLYALSSLRTPPLLVAILASTCRYLGVLVDEFQSMRRAAAARNFRGDRWWQQSQSSTWQRRAIGNMIGAMFIRTFDRGERIHQAMLSRGYQGNPPILEPPKWQKKDAWAIATAIVIAIAGQAIYLLQ
ncbi:cobalt ECF transporter T component CbiQ [Pseudanabaena sp. PCC 6802]|uniref:cobalt ECF transporter T component CbiQ n=1 Tax=Pseudanabaena sp. PCC 6802 TaxID=118173 RepID=UPI0003784ABD|nr:cobalt ECF transporter T component CbiQ [Pseudanabaena sp. PCC 6802]